MPSAGNRKKLHAMSKDIPEMFLKEIQCHFRMKKTSFHAAVSL